MPNVKGGTRVGFSLYTAGDIASIDYSIAGGNFGTITNDQVNGFNKGGYWTFYITMPNINVNSGMINFVFRDTAGNGVNAYNTGGNTKTFDITIDSTAPTGGALALAADTGISASDRVTNNGQVNASGIESGATWKYSTNAGSTWTNGSGSSFNLAVGSYAANAIQLRQSDAVGNTQTVSMGAVTVDGTAPELGAYNTTVGGGGGYFALPGQGLNSGGVINAKGGDRVLFSLWTAGGLVIADFKLQRPP